MKNDIIKILVLSFVVLIAAQLTHAQEYFIPGYIVNNNNDTLNGLLIIKTS